MLPDGETNRDEPTSSVILAGSSGSHLPPISVPGRHELAAGVVHAEHAEAEEVAAAAADLEVLGNALATRSRSGR